MDSRVMILDDEPYNVMIVRKYLRDEGYSNLLTLHRFHRGHGDDRPGEAEPLVAGHLDAQGKRAGHPAHSSTG